MVGNILRAAREERGLSLKDIENETSIRALYIEAIEKGKQDVLPSEVYVKGFIRNYATFLGLDADALARQYQEELHGTVEEKTDKVVPVAVPGKEEHGPFTTGSDFKERVEKSHRTQHILIALGIVIGLFVGSIYYFFGDDAVKKREQPSPVSQQVPSATNTTSAPAVPVPAPAVAPATPPVSAPPSAPADSAASPKQPDSKAGAVNVTAKFNDRCWMHVIADGQVIYEGIVDAGQMISWKGKDRVTVTAGNAGAVDIVYNGRDLGRLGNVGDVVEKRFTKDKVETGI